MSSEVCCSLTSSAGVTLKQTVKQQLPPVRTSTAIAAARTGTDGGLFSNANLPELLFEVYGSNGCGITSACGRDFGADTGLQTTSLVR